jgi:AmmeMemoRadiSam system protein A
MDDKQKQSLLKLARESIARRFTRVAPELPDDPALQEKRGIFVSLHKNGELRGCIGFIRAYHSIVDSVREMAWAAAFDDPRFQPLGESELTSLEIEISILSDLIPLTDPYSVEIGRDGLYIQHPHGSGLLLPQVPVEWEWDAATFLKQVCRKAGLHDKAWQDEGATLFRFEAEVFAESDFGLTK